MVAIAVQAPRRAGSSTKARSASTPAKSRKSRNENTSRTSPQVHQMPQVGFANSMPWTRSSPLRTRPISIAPTIRWSHAARRVHSEATAKHEREGVGEERVPGARHVDVEDARDVAHVALGGRHHQADPAPDQEQDESEQTEQRGDARSRCHRYSSTASGKSTPPRLQ